MTTRELPEDSVVADLMLRVLSPLGENRGIDALYVFGSASQGHMRNDSDVDLAFLSARPHDPVAVFDAAQTLASELCRNVDLIDLRRASTVMRSQILTKGRRLFTGDAVAAETFEMYAYSDYARLQEERAETIRAFESAYHD